jgi:hypothetical protein
MFEMAVNEIGAETTADIPVVSAPPWYESISIPISIWTTTAKISQ